MYTERPIRRSAVKRDHQKDFYREKNHQKFFYAVNTIRSSSLRRTVFYTEEPLKGFLHRENSQKIIYARRAPESILRGEYFSKVFCSENSVRRYTRQRRSFYTESTVITSSSQRGPPEGRPRRGDHQNVFYRDRSVMSVRRSSARRRPFKAKRKREPSKGSLHRKGRQRVVYLEEKVFYENRSEKTFRVSSVRRRASETLRYVGDR